MSSAPVKQTKFGATLFVKVAPSAARNRVQGFTEDADGQTYLQIQVTSPAEGGKANDAVIKFLAKALQIPKSAMTLKRGVTSRFKQVATECDLEDLRDKVSTLK